MNKKEILKYLNYSGKYTKDVKRRLNKLLKKYHPDNNKDDKTTILTLYEIKKELENGTLKYNCDFNNKKDYNILNKSNTYFYIFESMIERLKLQREKINKKINIIYKKINFHNEKIDNKQDELTFIEFEINELEEELNELLKMDVIDKSILILIILFILLGFLFKNVYVVFIDFILIFLELYYIYIRNNVYKEKRNKLVKSVKIFRNVKNEYGSLEEKIENLEKEEYKLKGERNIINNDLQYYSHELSKLNEKDYKKENIKENKSYTKK